jgi:predicted nucleic acid-binding protein
VEFVDTNVLLYTVSRAPEERGKAAIAREILRRRDLVLSVQVLQELYVQATRESRPDRLRHDQAVRLVESFCRYPVQELTLSIVRAARRLFVSSISRWGSFRALLGATPRARTNLAKNTCKDLGVETPP